MNNLGVILEENNNNNSDLEKSNENQIIPGEDAKNISFQNYSINFVNISFFKENNLENELKYQTQQLFFKEKQIYDLINGKTENNKVKMKKIEKQNKKQINKCNSEDIIILDSRKRQNELIKLISKDNKEFDKKENYTKNINLNININNNIQYEIEKNKEKEEENELNQSFNSLIKIAEKNCLFFSDTLQTEIYNKKDNINDLKVQKITSKVIKNKSKENDKKDNIILSSNKSLGFKNIKNNTNNKSKINKTKKEINDNSKIKNEKMNNNIKIKNSIPKRNNLNNKIKIYNRIKSLPKNNLNKNNRNLSFKLKEKDENFKIYRKIKNSDINSFSIGKMKQKTKENKQKDDNNIDENNKIKELTNGNIKNNFNYKTSTYKGNDQNFLNIKNAYSRNTFNGINSNRLMENKIICNKRFFEMNISLDNCYSLENNFEHKIDEESSKIYKRPTIFANIIKKVKSLDKLKIHKELTLNSSRQKKKNTNFIINKNDVKTINAYIKKNPKNLCYQSILKTNQNIYHNKRNHNNEEYMPRNTMNNFNTSKLNLKKYDDIYNNSFAKHLFKNNIIISSKLGDLLILEEKLCDVILGIKKNRRAENQSLDFFNYFFNYSMYKQIEKVFENDVDEEIVRLSLNYELISILICYKYSKNNEIIDVPQILEILQLCHRNLINIYEQILIKIKNDDIKNIKNIWVEKLSQIINYSKKSSEQIFPSENYIESLVGKINFNTNYLIKKLKNILYNGKYQNNNIIINFFKNLNQKTYEEINDFFKDYIYIIDNPECSILPQAYKPIHQNMQYQNYPYIKTPNKKRYTLVLDLNETLINLKYADHSKGLIRVRPYLYQFLDEVKLYYELILFTGSSENYTNSIIEGIERKKKYFDFIFNRHYLVKCGDCYLKDLSKIGRPLNSTIIIDNNPLNYKLQKENGICIKSFWGENNEDAALYHLIKILIDIAKDNNDVRDGISKYKDQIISKVSSNIFL